MKAILVSLSFQERRLVVGSPGAINWRGKLLQYFLLYRSVISLREKVSFVKNEFLREPTVLSLHLKQLLQGT